MEVIRESPTRRRRRPLRRLRRAAALQGDEESPTAPLADHNFSSFLMLTNLRDGMFSAELPMDKMPPGNVRIRVRDYKLEVMVVKTPHHDVTISTTNGGTASDDVTSTKPVYCGSISIPIYVNPTTLKFRLNDRGTLLLIEGQMKGVGTRRRLSLSTSDLRMASYAMEGQYLGVPGSKPGWESCAISLSGSAEELDARVASPVPRRYMGAGRSHSSLAEAGLQK